MSSERAYNLPFPDDEWDTFFPTEDAAWEVFLPEDDLEPAPEPGDFWTASEEFTDDLPF